MPPSSGLSTVAPGNVNNMEREGDRRRDGPGIEEASGFHRGIRVCPDHRRDRQRDRRAEIVGSIPGRLVPKGGAVAQNSMQKPELQRQPSML